MKERIHITIVRERDMVVMHTQIDGQPPKQIVARLPFGTSLRRELPRLVLRAISVGGGPKVGNVTLGECPSTKPAAHTAI